MIRHLLSLLIDFFVYGIRRQETPNVDMVHLSKSNQTANSLCFAGLVNLLGWCKKRGEEDRMIGGCQIRPASRLVHDIQEKHTLATLVLEKFQILALLVCSPSDLKELDLVVYESLRDLFHQVRELDEDKNPFVFLHFIPGILSIRR